MRTQAMLITVQLRAKFSLRKFELSTLFSTPLPSLSLSFSTNNDKDNDNRGKEDHNFLVSSFKTSRTLFLNECFKENKFQPSSLIYQVNSYIHTYIHTDR